MPLYEYQCESCHHRFEKIQKYSDPLIDVCPVCGGLVKKLFSSPSFLFKGTGFYATDYAKKSGSDAKKSGSESGDGKGSAANSDGSSSSDSSAASTSAPATPKTPAATSLTESSKKD